MNMRTLAAGLLGMVALAGCATTTPTALDRPAKTPTTTLTVDNRANGSTVNAHVDDRIEVVLGSRHQPGSTYWRFAPVTGPVLTSAGAPVTHGMPPGSPAGCGIAGAGCGTVTWTLVAASPGTTSISAHRTTCGEAIQCPAGKQDFTLKVHVLP
jgi:hypothetical protein